MQNQNLTLSALEHTWIIDLDGTLVEHNGYKNGEDKLLEGAKEFVDSIPKEDFILILTAREVAAKQKTELFLKEKGIRYNQILFEMPFGERILINDNKPSGLKCAHALTPERNKGLKDLKIEIDNNI